MEQAAAGEGAGESEAASLTRKTGTVNTMDRARFDRIKEKHGGYASWAVWAPPTRGPKSNIADLSVLDPARPGTLAMLNRRVVMVGLNISRSFAEPFRNFHDPSPSAQDYKIRYAFTGTPWSGAYMTDFIKHVEMVRSDELRRYLQAHRHVIRENINTLREELHDLDSQRPTILAFGATAYALLAEHLPAQDYGRLIRLTHYSHHMGQEHYRHTVLTQITNHSPGTGDWPDTPSPPRASPRRADSRCRGRSASAGRGCSDW